MREYTPKPNLQLSLRYQFVRQSDTEADVVDTTGEGQGQQRMFRIRIMRNGDWKLAWGHNIHGKTLGILGCGRIGQAMARRAQGFGMKLIGYDICENDEAKKLGITFVSLDELLAQSDFLSLHAAATAENRNLIGETQFRRMKPSSYLINTARGALIDENALGIAFS